MVLVIRLRTSQGMQRLLFKDGSATMEDLVLQTKDLTGIAPKDQRLELMPAGPGGVPRKIRGLPARTRLSAAGLSQGCVLRLIEGNGVRARARPKPAAASSSSAAAAGASRPKKKAFHMTFQAFVKSSGKPVVPDYAEYLNASRLRQRSVSSYAPAIHYKRQPYRHADVVCFQDPGVVLRFYNNSIPEIKKRVSRVGIMFGRYTEGINPLAEPELRDSLNRQKKWDYDASGVRADVFAIYEPPQEAMANGARFLSDPRQATVQFIAEALGLEPVGLIVCKHKDGNGDEKSKDNEHLPLTAKELITQAGMQGLFADQNGFSRFSIVVVEHQAQIEPVGFAASDTLVALARENLVEPASDDPYKMRIAAPEGAKPEDVPQVFMPKEDDPTGGRHTAEIKVPTGDPFKYDFMLVKVIVSTSRSAGKDAKVFRYNEFPVRGGDFKSYMSRHSDEPYQAKFSDFNLLLACPAILGEEVSYEIAEAVGAKEEFSQKLCGRLDDLFVSKSLF